MRSLAVLIWVGLASCSGEKPADESERTEPPAPAAESGKAEGDKTAQPDGAEKGGDQVGQEIGQEKARPRPAKLTAEQRREFRRLVREGRAQGKKKKWAEAVAAFEKAVAIHPGSGWAYSELGWAAFQIKEYEKSLKASERSVQLAVEPSLRAASLYNAGRVAEATGDRARAIAVYAESLRLRPNKVVLGRLEKLGGTAPEKVTAALACEVPVTVDKLCECLRRDVVAVTGCGPLDEAASGPLRVFVVTSSEDDDGYHLESSHWLVHRDAGTVRVVASLPETRWERFLDEEFALRGIETRTIGGKRVHAVGYAVLRSDEAYEDMFESLDTMYVTLCVEEDGAVRCPLSVETGRRYRADVQLDDDDDLRESFVERHGARPPIEERHVFELVVNPDGTVSARPVEGEVSREDRALLKKQRLW